VVTNTDPPQDRQTLILDRALELFARHGYAGTGMRAIAQASGIREATLYHYFATKEALMDALISHHSPPPGFFREVIPRGLPLREVLFGAAIGFLEAMRQPRNEQFLRVMLVEAHHHEGWARALSARFSVI
jgi:AcrR family transcriptional regulator